MKTHDGTAAGKIELFRLAPLLLRTVDVDGTADFAVETGHYVADDLDTVAATSESGSS